MYFDLQKAIELVGQKVTENITFNFDVYNKSQSKISFCLEKFYENNAQKRKKRSVVWPMNHNKELIDGDGWYLNKKEASEATDDNNIANIRKSRNSVVLNQATGRKLLSLDNNTTFKDIENEVLSNDIVSRALGTDVCRYCVKECPDN